MRCLRCKRGSFYMLEAVIAIMIMITTLAMTLVRPQSSQRFDVANYKVSVYNVLKVSDDVGDLSVWVLNNDTDSIKYEIESNAQTQLDYWVVIYNRTHALSEEPDLTSENVAVVSYFLAGWFGSYDPRELRVFMWGFD